MFSDKDSERKGWQILIATGINPSKWLYNGRLVGAGMIEHHFTHKESKQEIVLIEREEHERKNNRSFFWHSPSSDSHPAHHDSGQRGGVPAWGVH